MEDDGTDGPAFLCLRRNQSRQPRPPEMPSVGRSADSTITKPFNLTEMQNPDMRRFRATDNTLYFNTRDELVRVPLDRVAYFETDSNYCDVIFINGLRATLLTSLSNIEQILDGRPRSDDALFIRIGKRHIVNRRYIHSINIPRQLLILSDLCGGMVHKLTISREALKSLKQFYIDNLQ